MVDKLLNQKFPVQTAGPAVAENKIFPMPRNVARIFPERYPQNGGYARFLSKIFS